MAECDQYQAPALPPPPPSLEPRLEGTKRGEQKTGKGAMQGVPVVIRVVSTSSRRYPMASSVLAWPPFGTRARNGNRSPLPRPATQRNSSLHQPGFSSLPPPPSLSAIQPSPTIRSRMIPISLAFNSACSLHPHLTPALQQPLTSNARRPSGPTRPASAAAPATPPPSDPEPPPSQTEA
jgi:hypothetical protein